MNVLILGATGHLGPYVINVLKPHYNLRLTDIRPPATDTGCEFVTVDVGSLEQVMKAAEGMDAIVNLSVLRHHRQVAFDVSTRGCYNMMRAAVEHGIQRIINTGPHFTLAGATYEWFDCEIGPDIPPQPGTNLYALTKSLGQEICKVFTENYDLYVQTYLFCNFIHRDHLRHGRESSGFAGTWEDTAEVFRLGLEIDLDKLPSKCEVFYIFNDIPHGKFSNEKAKRILGFAPKDDVSALWRKEGADDGSFRF
jgi:nucleoside-diphosphate-sugar epimerase